MLQMFNMGTINNEKRKGKTERERLHKHQGKSRELERAAEVLFIFFFQSFEFILQHIFFSSFYHLQPQK